MQNGLYAPPALKRACPLGGGGGLWPITKKYDERHKERNDGKCHIQYPDPPK